VPRWSVDIICKRAEHLGEVEAPDERSAIKKAAEVFDIPPERQNRMTVTKITKLTHSGLISLTHRLM
jgi:hypothetical protein